MNLEAEGLEAILAVRMAAQKRFGNPVFVRHDAEAERTVAPAVAAAADVAEWMAAQPALPPALRVGERGVCFIGRSPADCGAAGPEDDVSLGRLAGRVVLVTGGAQGFGLGIVEEMLAEGAAVTVADINAELGAAVAARLNQEYEGRRAQFVKMDVTSLASIEAGVAAAVRHFGGLDLFIANAGVLKAGGLEEMDEQAFDFVTNVNYKAYFLCAKAVAPVMKRQFHYDESHVMDIIQVNSKSGLQGSNRNFAYAGSKFGAIGLTQSFALELIPWNIKVNSICPGNYYDGPLWSDPEKGLFVQYLRAGKVPGAQTVEDVKRAYLAKSPIPRGCQPIDVARAILYLHEQVYETGQALPVAGGQVMLK